MNSFAHFQLQPELNETLEKIGFTKPTKTQEQTIPLSLELKDLLVCAPTGTGKTASFAIPIIEKLIFDHHAKALVLAPTRELAQQIFDVFKQLAGDNHKLKPVLLVGGADIRRQINALNKNPKIVIATPGRLNDHLKRKTVKLDQVKSFILDEGDRMLDMGFMPQIETIIKFLPKDRQTCLYTATLPVKIANLANKVLTNPVRVTIGQDSMPVEKIKQSIVEVSGKKKFDVIVDELNSRSGSIIIFVRTKRRTDFLFKTLKSFGFAATAIHGDKTQGQRNKAIKQFKEGKVRVLCATDVAARGLDVPSVEHVINFDLPMHTEDYVHRIGRTARNGAEGEALSFVSVEEQKNWIAIAKKYKIPGTELKNIVVRTKAKKKKGFRKKPGGKKFGVSNSKSPSQSKKRRRNQARNARKKP